MLVFRQTTLIINISFLFKVYDYRNHEHMFQNRLKINEFLCLIPDTHFQVNIIILIVDERFNKKFIPLLSVHLF